MFTASHDSTIRIWDLSGIDDDPTSKTGGGGPAGSSRVPSTSNFSRARVGPHQQALPPISGRLEKNGHANGGYDSPADKTKIQIESMGYPPSSNNNNNYDLREDRRSVLSNGHRRY